MRIAVICIILLFPVQVLAQIDQVSGFLELGISPISYKGDLSQGYQKWGAAFHLGLKKNVKKKLNGHINLMVGNITGQNPDYAYPSATPNLYFRSSLISLNYDLQFNLIKKKNYIFYISQGIGLMRFVVRDEDNNNLSGKLNTRAKNENYNNICLMFPHAVGFMYFLPNNYGAGIQIGRLVPTTDYLDNISKLSNYGKADNVLMVKFTFIAPLAYKKS